MHHAQFEPLVWDFDGRTGERGMRGFLDTDWEALDDHTWRFQLREGVTFHNDEPFNAEAVKFGIDRVFADDYTPAPSPSRSPRWRSRERCSPRFCG